MAIGFVEQLRSVLESRQKEGGTSILYPRPHRNTVYVVLLYRTCRSHSRKFLLYSRSLYYYRLPPTSILRVNFLSVKSLFSERVPFFPLCSAAGSVIHPNVHLKGSTCIGSFTVIEPNCFIVDSINSFFNISFF